MIIDETQFQSKPPKLNTRVRSAHCEGWNDSFRLPNSGPKSLDGRNGNPESRNMEVLVLGRPGLERTTLHRFLAAAGHEVCVCHDRHWGCVGMDGVCPLDDRTINVAIAGVEAGDRFDPQGIACVYRAQIALVTVGATEHDPVLPYSTIAVERVDATLLDGIETIRTSRRTPQ
jgi:hypothetical protein